MRIDDQLSFLAQLHRGPTIRVALMSCPSMAPSPKNPEISGDWGFSLPPLPRMPAVFPTSCCVSETDFGACQRLVHRVHMSRSFQRQRCGRQRDARASARSLPCRILVSPESKARADEQERRPGALKIRSSVHGTCSALRSERVTRPSRLLSWVAGSLTPTLSWARLVPQLVQLLTRPLLL